MSDRAQAIERGSDAWAARCVARTLADLERERRRLVERIRELDRMRAQILAVFERPEERGL